MRRILMLFLSAILAFGGLANLPGKVAASETTDLAAAIMSYRQALGLDAIPCATCDTVYDRIWITEPTVTAGTMTCPVCATRSSAGTRHGSIG